MKVGLCLNNLGSSQLAAEAIAWADKACASGHSATLFYECVEKPCLPLSFMVTNLADAWGFGGVLIATDLSTAAKVAGFPSAEKKIFHVWDLEWVRRPGQYRELQSVYGDPRLLLTARSAEHAALISEAWNRPVAVAGRIELVAGAA